MNGNKNSTNNDLLDQWLLSVKEVGLNDNQVLGLAYLNSAIPTVRFFTYQNQDIILPLQNIISKVGDIGNEGSNIYHLFREIYFAALTKDKDLESIDEGLPDTFFSQDKNPYFKNLNSEFGFFKRSLVSINLINRLGQILEISGVGVLEAFQLGHSHTNYLLRSSSGDNAALALSMATILPQYLAGIIDMIPNTSSLYRRKDFWIFSKIFYDVIVSEFEDDLVFAEWLWYFHNYIFYVNETGSTKIKPEWSLEYPKFEIEMLKAIVELLPGYYSLNSNIGNQKINSGKKFTRWEEFFLILNEHLKTNYELKSPITAFSNMGEFNNYLAYKFFATCQVMLANHK
ncbi:hypothetical protein NMK71_04840 [Weeksellaceae bacterium KMM 9713]|uniref:Uncharacterized protein n=1 Tax=Profundicola chukchiensis TaxID=2961959 RepID=A0A9X4RWG8_9FLAO|nr:hypothetical protein [Profundicola chukchiensis]MDG4945732.1 hypothetical protein [Profundicola chukchiensis]